MLKSELFKIVNKRNTRLLLLIHSIGFPIFMMTGASIESNDVSAVEGLFIEQIAGWIISFGTSIILIPVWVCFFIGQEFATCHVNKVVFATSKKFYFWAKVSYCVIVALFFSVLETGILVLCVKVSAFDQLAILPEFLGAFVAQAMVVNLLYSLIFMSITFWVRSAVTALVLAYFLPQLDGILFLLADKLLHLKFFWLPFQLIQSLYTASARLSSIKYINPVTLDAFSIIPPVFMTGVVLLLSYISFDKRDMKVLTD